jgi:hypothetical protein
MKNILLHHVLSIKDISHICFPTILKLAHDAMHKASITLIIMETEMCASRLHKRGQCCQLYGDLLHCHN